MAIRTQEELTDRIADDYGWRIREVSELKTLVSSAASSDIRRNVIARSGIALLYAHWEGFVKAAGTYFLEYVSMQREPIDSLQTNFVTLILKSRIEQANRSKKYSAFEEVTKFLLENSHSQARVPFKKVVNTQANLSSTVLEEISWCLGIDYGHFLARQKLIDTRLLGRRNHIAHGRDLRVEQDDFVELADEVVALMDSFKALVENSACLGSFKKVA